MWHRFKLRILRSMIDRYLRHNELSELLIEIEYRRKRMFYEDNIWDTRAYYVEHLDKARSYFNQTLTGK